MMERARRSAHSKMMQRVVNCDGVRMGTSRLPTASFVRTIPYRKECSIASRLSEMVVLLLYGAGGGIRSLMILLDIYFKRRQGKFKKKLSSTGKSLLSKQRTSFACFFFTLCAVSSLFDDSVGRCG